MWDEPIDVVGRQPGGREGIFDNVLDHRDRVFENFAPLHAQMTDGAGRGGTAIHIQLVLVAPVRAKVRRQYSPACTVSGLLLQAQYDGSGAVAEKNAG